MRKINKGEPLPEFVDFRKKNPSANWSDFHQNAKDVYVATREQVLIDEQNCLCGYTEIPINDIKDARINGFWNTPKAVYTEGSPINPSTYQNTLLPISQSF